MADAAKPTIRKVRTKTLEIAYEESGPESGLPVLMMHGFPYDPRAFDGMVAPLIAAAIPKVKVPGIVIEFGLGVIIGPDVLGWVKIDEPLEVLGLLALGFLLANADLLWTRVRAELREARSDRTETRSSGRSEP